MTNVPRYLLIGSSIVSILLIYIGLSIPGYEIYRNLGTNLFGISIMALIALITFEKMESSTQKTVEGIKSSTDETLAKMEEVADKQIQEYKNIAAELKESNKKLAGVFGSLKTLADDVEERKMLGPDLDIGFGNNQKEITLTTGIEKTVEIRLSNYGHFPAENVNFEILFPPEIEILEAENFEIHEHISDSKYPKYTGIQYKEETFDADVFWNYHVKLKIPESAIKKFELPFMCSCKNRPLENGKLTINAIG